MIELIKEDEKVKIEDSNGLTVKELTLSSRYYLKIFFIKIPVNQWLVNKILK